MTVIFDRYAKMQFQVLPKGDDRLTFEIVVPKMTSTRHVAAAGFYHCLGRSDIIRTD